ncbi:MAG: hypothetical protein KKD99_06390 [Proteobacteria bacterium]|nr:hypothetical protein [Pseudomonadota bacterium]MBU4355876.1 hypothetical protein [Pseudomonadota bacterium]MBU4448196.1 hypothetical protein [Pseudomonadota bacterium]MCG2773894.1 hypothetical protein [Desulfobacterales bacterium]
MPLRPQVKIVGRLLRGEDLERLSREPGVSAAGFCQWRGQGHIAGRAEWKKPSQDGRAPETMRWRRLKRAAFMSRKCQRRQIFW